MASDTVVPNLGPAIEARAGQPQSVSSDGLSVSGQSLAAMIEADKYLKQIAAASKRGRGMRFVKIVPPGTV